MREFIDRSVIKRALPGLIILELLLAVLLVAGGLQLVAGVLFLVLTFTIYYYEKLH